MKNLLILLISLTLSICATAQPNWTLVNSGLPVGDGIGQISVGLSNSTALWALAVDGTGAIIDSYTKSTNGGTTWTVGTFSAGMVGLSQLFAIDATTCWAVMNSGAQQGVWKTTNGGTSWTRKPAGFTTASFADLMHFFNANDGVVVGDPLGGYFEIYTTSDGGETWTRVPSASITPAPTSGEYGITGDYCAVGNDIWFGTNFGKVFHSTDKGLTWTGTLTSFGNAEVVAPVFSSATHGFAYRSYLNLGLEPAISTTTDGGATWVSTNVVGDMYARYFSYVPGTTATFVGSAAAAGANGMSFSTDGGTTWYTITSGYDFGATAWVNDSTGWAGSTAAAKSPLTTGGMYVYNGPALVAAAPVANFHADVTSVIKGGTIHYTDQSTGFLTNWAWTFPGGTPASSTLQNPVVVYNTSGTYNVTLTATNAFGSNTMTKNNYIYVGGVGIDDHTSATVAIFPNPVKDVLNIQGSGSIQEVNILNMVGQVVLSQKPDAAALTINTSDLKTGIYSIQIKIAGGYIYKKIVVN